ncbi:hypothetical protein Wenmar_02708 [Wenxinia marina DSM 24838]|uniref:Uncharacterized protein n=1 Tax=Wenxinia marina DSM 24838 TaxID=1123501 RepID=A0A0D0NKY8_9RHOB|nr:hypothetical protein Wenmar_02708 [Wenxinia marina DSM 24838]
MSRSANAIFVLALWVCLLTLWLSSRANNSLT